MKGKRFSGILISCIVTLLVSMEAVFISATWAGKPDWGGPKPETTECYGYATLSDGYAITSDGEWVIVNEAQYADRESPVPGEDMVEFLIDVQTNELLRSRTVLGMIEKTKKSEYLSSRRVSFNDFHPYHSAVETPPPAGQSKRVFEILGEEEYGALGGLVHFAVCWWESSGAVDYVAFIIDGITQEAVGGDENYRTSDLGHVIYYLDYWPEEDDPNGIGPPSDSYPTWTFDPGSGLDPSDSVTLYVMRTVGQGQSQGGAYQRVDLAEYDE